MLCPACKRTRLKTTEVEIRRVNAITMKISSQEKITEAECLDCGWIGALEQPALATC